MLRSSCLCHLYLFFFFNDTATTEIYTLSLHDALPISAIAWRLMWDTKVILLPAGGPCWGGACLQEPPLEELGRRPVHRQNVRIPQEMMRVVRNYESLKRDSGGGATPDEIGAL